MDSVFAQPSFDLRSVPLASEPLAAVGRDAVEARAQRCKSTRLRQLFQPLYWQVGLRIVGVSGFTIPGLFRQQAAGVRVGLDEEFLIPRVRRACPYQLS